MSAVFLISLSIASNMLCCFAWKWKLIIYIYIIKFYMFIKRQIVWEIKDGKSLIQSLPWSVFGASVWWYWCEWVTVSFLMAGWVYKPPPAFNTLVWRPFVQRSARHTHATRFPSLSILTFHPGGNGSTDTALHHEVFHPTALFHVVGVPRLFSSHHRGKW